MLRFLCALSVVLVLVTFESSCRKRRVDVPAALPPPSTTAPDQSRSPAPTPGTTTAPVPHPASPVKEQPKYQVNRPPQSAEPQPQQPAPPRRSSRPSNGPTAEPNTAGQPNQAPRLGDILTPEQERQYNAAIDQSLARAQTSLGSIATRQLTKDQQAVSAQIQSFIQQAQTTRKSNLPAARSLAERADVLARDLVESLR